jgi:type IV secretion system protein VirB11
MQPGERPLRAFLQPIQDLLDHPSVREIVINRPGEVGFETRDGWAWRDEAAFTFDRLDQIGILAGWLLAKDMDAENPICMTTLPDGQRCTICRPPVTLPGSISITIRRPSQAVQTVHDPDFKVLLEAATGNVGRRSKVDEHLLALYQQKDWPEFFSLAVKSHKTIAATGSTGSGKTTMIRRIMREIPLDERLVTIEDTDEFGALPQRNRCSLFYGSANVTALDLATASMRMRPDRVVMQELRGAEAFAYIRVLAAGHPGGLTTWHAEDGDPFTPLALMAKTSEEGRNIPDDKLLVILRRFIDIVAFCKRDENGFSVPSVWFRAAEEIAQ